MMSKKMEKALNEQINAEAYSAYLYLAMAAYFEAENLPGMANWMRIQTQEETAHALKFFDFVNERRGRVVLKAIDQPQKEWKSPLAAFEAAFAHEQLVTGRIDDLVNLAIQAKDHATAAFLQWFVDEQVEEESSVDRIVQMLKMAEKAPGAMFMIDRDLGQRTFTPPAE
ncbi:ferritin [Anaerobaca lacustris]|uniref:Ferritin n=1 Tax=Anaerobaca lacustris TaxID=3044600 RepID=A0AAW6TUH8_9BACT|nr:ferritin [Sedimentisphaerales bacterium M17dextr]